MTGLVGWLDFTPRPCDERALLAAMLGAHDASAQAGSSITGRGWALAAGSLNPIGYAVGAVGDIAVAAAGRPRFIASEYETIHRERGIASAVAAAYMKAGEGVFSLLGGDFSLAIVDSAHRYLLAGIDRMGVHALHYCVAGETLVLGSSNDAISAHLAARSGEAEGSELDPQAIHDYLYFHMVPAPGTIYRGRARLTPGSLLRFERGQVATTRYWSMRFEENSQASFAALKEEFVATLQDAVRLAVEGAKTGCFLSGGTDSSTMSGLLGHVTGAPARTYSIGFDEPGYDEMAYARIAAKHFGTEHHEYYVTPADVVDAIPRIAAAYDQPFGNSSAVPTYYCAKLAHADGIERLIGGDGGDELFGGNERYARQHVFSLYERVPGALRENLVAPVIRNFPGAGALAVVRKARSYVEQASIPMPARLETYNLLERIGRERLFTGRFLAAIDTNRPVTLLEEIYHGADAGSLINRMLALDFRITLADNDLPKVIGSAELAGVAVAFPMLDDAVVAFSAKLPPRYKLKGTALRWFFKEALRDFLPPEIIVKQKHGFGMPFGPWLTRDARLKEIVADSLADFARRGIVRTDFLAELTREHLNAHAGYYGTLVWVLVMLEQWLNSHGHGSFRLD